MGIPVYWSLSPSINPPTALKPTLKRTRPLPSSIRRQPRARDHRPSYSEIVRRQTADDEDCPVAASHRHHPRLGVPPRDQPHETDDFIEQLEVFSNSTRIHNRPPYDPAILETLHFPPQLPPTGGPLSIRGVPVYTDGIPTPIPEPTIPEPRYMEPWGVQYAESTSSSTSESDPSSPRRRQPPMVIGSYDTRDATPFDGYGIFIESSPTSEDEMPQPPVRVAPPRVRRPIVD
jgi:hypothetical protein